MRPKFVLLVTIVAILKHSNEAKVDKKTPKEIANKITFIVYGKSVDKFQEYKYKNAMSIKNSRYFNSKQPTIFHAFGYDESPSSQSVQSLISAYTFQPKTNVVLFNYNSLVNTGGNFYSACLNSTAIGEALGIFLCQFIPKVQTGSKIHYTCYSVGCTITKYMSDKYKNCASKSHPVLEWITGMDPINPQMGVPLCIIPELNKHDGNFVEIIHTNAKIVGSDNPDVHVDFWPNGGHYQKSCKSPLHGYSLDNWCSHSMSWVYYSEALTKSPSSFIGKNCSVLPLTNDCRVSYPCCKCQNKVTNTIGLNVDKKAPGHYFFKSRELYPFADSKQGLNFGNSSGVFTCTTRSYKK